MGGKILMNSNSSARLYDYRVVSRGSLPHFSLEYSLIPYHEKQFSMPIFQYVVWHYDDGQCKSFRVFFLFSSLLFFFFVGELPYLLRGTAMRGNGRVRGRLKDYRGGQSVKKAASSIFYY